MLKSRSLPPASITGDLMDHLKLLSIIDAIFIFILLGAGMVTAGLTLGTVGTLVWTSPGAAGAVVPVLAITGITVALLGGMAGLSAASALGIRKGRARAWQTVLAILSLSSAPFGTAFGAYALWVCWLNPSTRDQFASSSKGEIGRMALGLMVLGSPFLFIVALSISAAIPTRLAPLDAEVAPIEDRASRVALGDPLPSLTDETGSSGRSPARPTGIHTEELTFPTRNSAMGLQQLQGTLTLPEGLEGPRPGVILVHGSGPANRHEDSPGELVASYDEPLPLFDRLAEHLAQEGFAVLTWDKRSCASCYPGLHAGDRVGEFRFQLFMDDALAAADALALRPEVDGRALVVIGHSQGGGFAPHLAAADPRFAAVVMLAGFTGTFRDALLDQLERIAVIRERQWDLLGAWSTRAQAASIRHCLDKMEAPLPTASPGDPDPLEEMCIGGGVSLRALAEYETLNRRTVAAIQQLEVPLFAASGTVDRNVPPAELSTIREAARGKDAEFHLIAGMGHGLRGLLQPADPPVIHPELLRRLDGFLASVPWPQGPQSDQSP